MDYVTKVAGPRHTYINGFNNSGISLPTSICKVDFQIDELPVTYLYHFKTYIDVTVRNKPQYSVKIFGLFHMKHLRNRKNKYVITVLCFSKKSRFLLMIYWHRKSFWHVDSRSLNGIVILSVKNEFANQYHKYTLKGNIIVFFNSLKTST